MNLEELQDRILKKFDEAKKDCDRSIVFWYDEDGQFSEFIDKLDLGDIKIWRLMPNNNFATKYLLESVDKESDYLIYADFKRPANEDNWLLDIELYSDQFSTDKVSLIMSDLGIKDLSLKDIVGKTVKFFDNNKMVDRLKSYNIEEYNEDDLVCGMISSLCDMKILDFEGAIKNLIKAGFDEENNQYYKNLSEFFDLGLFWNRVKKEFGYIDDNPTLKGLFMTIAISSLANEVSFALPEKLKKYVSQKPSSCAVFINHWMSHYDDYEILQKLLIELEEELDLDSIVKRVDIDTYITAETFSIFDRSLIRKIIDSLINGEENYDDYLKAINKRKGLYWYRRYRSIYEALYFAIQIYIEKKKLQRGFGALDAKEMIERYTNEYYKIDYCYRKFILNYDDVDNPDLFVDLKENVDNIYDNWYLKSITPCWNDSMLNESSEFLINGVRLQENFYKDEIAKVLAKNDRDKIIVIISDALRYDVAVELKELLNMDTKGSADISYMLGVVPSITKMGMSALLPHNIIDINDDGLVFVDDIDSSSTENRDKILKMNYKNSAAINYEDFMGMTREEGRQLIKSNRVIYIYHNAIDAIGDKAITESKVFVACDEALEELKKAIERLNNLSVTNIIITSDHGFIYKRKKMEESDKIEVGSECKINKRYVLTNERFDIPGVFAINVRFLKDKPQVLVPKNIGIFKAAGSGINYVHGGSSLQEVVIPLLRYKNLKMSKEEAITKANIVLTTQNKKITNNTFTLTFFQVDRVDDEEKVVPNTFKIYMEDLDTGEVISNVNTIVADKKSQNYDERVFKIRFTLKSGNYDKTKNYYLIIEDDSKVLDKVPFKINLGITNDFDLI